MLSQTRTATTARHLCGPAIVLSLGCLEVRPPNADGAVDGGPPQVPTVVNGIVDTNGLYRSVTKVNGACSGTLLSSGRIATAAHCVCTEHAPNATQMALGAVSVYDTTQCSGTATVTFVEATADGGVRETNAQGTAVVHSDFEILLGRSMTGDRFVLPGRSRGDMAFIDLDGPSDLPPIPPTAPTQAPTRGDIVTIVGFGFTGSTARDYGTRRFGRNLVTSVTSELVEIGGGLAPMNGIGCFGDSGGALLLQRMVAGTLRDTLAGIASTSNCVSTSGYTNVSEQARYTWLTRTCNNCAVTFVSPARNARFAPGEVMPLHIRTTGLPSYLRIVALRGDGTELSTVPHTTAGPREHRQMITIPESWGVGNDRQLCVTSDIPAWTTCLPFQIGYPICPASTVTCAGSCADMRTDVLNCGACGNRCSVSSHARPTCDNSRCGFTCDAGFADCDGSAANGCEADLRSDRNHCNGCGRSCTGSAACVAGACMPPVTTCTAPLRSCAGSCVNVDTDPSHCGACETSCPTPPHATAVCRNRNCGVWCAAGRGDCNGTASDGCEADLAGDASHCGACGSRCGFGQTCSSGRCVAAPPVCGTLANCGGVCRDLQTDNANCGGCGNACVGARTCRAGLCAEPMTVCGPGLTLCAGRCVSTLTDDRNCGACGAECTAVGWVCSAGRCAAPMSGCTGPGQMYCGGVCVNVYSDASNCGACGIVCAGGARCSEGRCAAGASTVVVRCVPPAGWQVLDAHWGLSGSWHRNDTNDGDPGTAFEFRTSVPEGDRLLVTFRLRDNLGRERWAYDFSNDPTGSGVVGAPQCATTATRNGASVPLHYVANGSPGSLPCNYTNLLVPTPTAASPAVCW